MPASVNAYALQPSIPSDGGSVTSRSPPLLQSEYRNINRFNIRFASRLLLSTRLTLIRLTLFRKPWVYGVNISNIHCRYLCLHFLFQTLQHGSHHTFDADWNAPLPITLRDSLASAAVFIPVHHPRVIARLVSCYALFK